MPNPLCKTSPLYANTNQFCQHFSSSFSNNQPLCLHGLLTFRFDFPVFMESQTSELISPQALHGNNTQHTTHNTQHTTHYTQHTTTGNPYTLSLCHRTREFDAPTSHNTSNNSSLRHNKKIVAKHRSTRKLGNGHHSQKTRRLEWQDH